MNVGHLGLVFLVLGVARLAEAAPTQVTARYADGQVFVKWKSEASPPETYAIYSSTGPLTDISQGQLEGRLFEFEWSATAPSQQTGGAVIAWRIPDGSGGIDTLAADDGLFVDTVHEAESRFYAVVRWGETVVTNSNRSNMVTSVVSLADPPECHLQHEYTQAGTFLIRLYEMWADGREHHFDQRPDFPVTANIHKNGMPSLFFVSRRVTATTTPRPVTYWLHGGSGSAKQSLPGDRPTVGIDPEDGLLVAHNDDFVHRSPWVPGGILEEDSNTWHFGWTERHDPFDSTYTAAVGDTLVNYTQRRMAWIHSWLVAHEGADPLRTAMQGHSVGSAGTTAFAQAFPDLLSTASVFSNGFEGPNAGPVDNYMYGPESLNLPTTLEGPSGTPVGFFDCFDLTTPKSGQRDLPLMRIFHGKHDSDGTMCWDAEVVAQFRAADSLGFGVHLYWDERAHGLDSGAGHWFYGESGTDQTHRDDVATQELYRRNDSYPGFFNHRIDPNGKDPGDGTRGTSVDSVYSGDDWGTWGGYHDWDLATVFDLPAYWQATLYLTNPGGGGVDVCPFDSLTCSVSVRKPQQFLPDPGALLRWVLLNADGDTLDTELTTVADDGLVVAHGIVLRKDAPRRLRFAVDGATAVGDASPTGGAARVQLRLHGHPVRDELDLSLPLRRAGRVVLDVHDVTGRRVERLVDGAYLPGEHRVRWDTSTWPQGVYALSVESGGMRLVERVIVVR